MVLSAAQGGEGGPEVHRGVPERWPEGRGERQNLTMARTPKVGELSKLKLPGFRLRQTARSARLLSDRLRQTARGLDEADSDPSRYKPFAMFTPFAMLTKHPLTSQMAFRPELWEFP